MGVINEPAEAIAEFVSLLGEAQVMSEPGGLREF